jgi:trimeric autotransporter adhesin
MDSTYTASGVYVTTGMTAAGCIQSDTLRLTINPSISSDTTVVACNSFTWMDSTYTASGVYVTTGMTAAGCTQSDTLRLTINPSISSYTTVIACNSFTWKDSTYTASGVYVKTGMTAAGCTQSDTLHLMIEPNKNGIAVIGYGSTAGSGYAEVCKGLNNGFIGAFIQFTGGVAPQ